MKPRDMTFVAGIALLVPASLGLLVTGVPTFLSPFPFLTVLPAFFVGPLAVLTPMALFFAWAYPLFRGQTVVPIRSYVLLAVLTGLGVWYFVESWSYGLKYQGSRLTYTLCILNVLWLLVLWIIFLSRWGKQSFLWNVAAHWLLFAWLGWYAFPYLGELP